MLEPGGISLSQKPEADILFLMREDFYPPLVLCICLIHGLPACKWH